MLIKILIITLLLTGCSRNDVIDEETLWDGISMDTHMKFINNGYKYILDDNNNYMYINDNDDKIIYAFDIFKENYNFLVVTDDQELRFDWNAEKIYFNEGFYEYYSKKYYYYDSKYEDFDFSIYDEDVSDVKLYFDNEMIRLGLDDTYLPRIINTEFDIGGEMLWDLLMGL